jgi:hypothetical protein
MKLSLFSVGLITLSTLLVVKGVGLITTMSQNFGLVSSANSPQNPSAFRPGLISTSATSEEINEENAIETNSQEDLLEAQNNTPPTRVVVDNKDVVQYTREDLEVFGSLSKRSTDLNKKEQDIELKQAALTAIETKLNQKIQQIQLEQQKLEKIKEVYSERQSTEIKSLANIYSNMKPRDAAAIFDQLDMPLLVKIVSAMKERSVAQVVSQMNPSKVRDLSIELSNSNVYK